MARFYITPENWDSAHWQLEGDEAKHCIKVMRLSIGDTCTIFDGRGQACMATINELEGHQRVHLTPQTPLENKAAQLTKITLCQSIPKGSNMDWIIQKSVEMGVSEIQPLMTDRTISRCEGKEAKSKQAKWQRTALEACKQCGQNLIPTIALPQTFQEWAKTQALHLPKLRLIASLAPGAIPLRTRLEQARATGAKEVAYIVGPEGDFTPAETEKCLQLDFSPIDLGPIVLRVETATLFGLSALRYALD